MSDQAKQLARRGSTRINSTNQVTIPVDALARACLRAGDRLRAEVRAAGEIVLVREVDPLERFAGAWAGNYPQGYLDRLRDDWD